MTTDRQEVQFVEVQRFRQPWLWALLIVSTVTPVALFGWGLYVQLVVGRPWGGKPMSDVALILSGCGAIVLAVGIVTLLWTARLTVVVDDHGLSVRYVPFHWSMKKIPLHDVTSVEAVTYSPILEYGGWGMRCGRKGKAYNVSGNRGVLLTFTNGKRLLVGSQRADELATAIHGTWTGRNHT
jgi:hypothetical protein